MGPRVVHVHDSHATDWTNYGNLTGPWYGDAVDHSIVTAMVDEGVMQLTNTSTRRDAWATLIPNYSSGAVAIKINLNCAGSIDDSDNKIDALPQPVNAVIAGLKEIGVAEADIWVYDVTDGGHDGVIPTRFKAKITSYYPNVKFYAHASDPWPTGSYHPTEKVTFNPPNPAYPLNPRPLCNPIVNAAYLINMPIMKKHLAAGMTLGFKNHFGSIWLGFEDGEDENLHDYITFWRDIFTPDYNPLVEIYSHSHIVGKTVLTVGDGLYGDRVSNVSVPERWTIFGNDSPNSLFFSCDPVAIDCVMADIIESESHVSSKADYYLRLAETAGLGVYERGDRSNPVNPVYQKIEYIPIDRG